MRPCSALSLWPRMRSNTLAGASFPRRAVSSDATPPFGDERTRDRFVVQRADLFQRVRERVVSDVVEQRRGPDDRLLLLADRGGVFRFAKERERASREVVGAERVLESRVCRARIDEVRPSELADVPESLKDFGVDEAERELVDANVIPDGVAQDLEVHGPGGAIPSGRRS